METIPDFLRALVALGVVVLLMLGVAWIARRMPGLQSYMSGAIVGKEPRMKTVSSLMLDARHRIVIVSIDGVEKTFILSPESAQEVKS